MATELMRNNPGMMSMMENMVGGMSQEQLDAMVGNGLCICAAVIVQHVAAVPCSSTPAAHPRIIMLHITILGSCVNVMQASVHMRTGSRDGAASHHHSTGQGTGGSAQGAQELLSSWSVHVSSSQNELPQIQAAYCNL